ADRRLRAPERGGELLDVPALRVHDTLPRLRLFHRREALALVHRDLTQQHVARVTSVRDHACWNRLAARSVRRLPATLAVDEHVRRIPARGRTNELPRLWVRPHENRLEYALLGDRL